MRLIDALLEESVSVPMGTPLTAALARREPQAEQMLRQIKDIGRDVQDAMVVEASNVAEYIYTHLNDDKPLSLHEFPRLTPPYEKLWVEMRPPTTLRWLDGTERPSDMPPVWGVLFDAMDLQDEPRTDLPPVFGRETTRWMMVVSTFVGNAKRRTPVWVASLAVALDEQGQLVGDESNLRYVSNLTGGQYASRAMQEAASATEVSTLEIGGNGENPNAVFHEPMMVFALIYPALFAVNLMHCTNVTLDAHTQPPRLARHYEKRHGHPAFTWHTLNIKPMVKVLRDEGHAEKTGIRTALHLCRGHFKTFSGKGLFGKYRGTFWWGAQVRGSADAGVRGKDYRIAGTEDFVEERHAEDRQGD